MSLRFLIKPEVLNQKRDRKLGEHVIPTSRQLTTSQEDRKVILSERLSPFVSIVDLSQHMTQIWVRGVASSIRVRRQSFLPLDGGVKGVFKGQFVIVDPVVGNVEPLVDV